jgi:hypothetical protein
MQVTYSWISTMYLFQLDPLQAGRVFSSSSSSARLAQAGAPWWPLGVGVESENVGNVLVLDSFPSSVLLGIRLVAYGRAPDALSMWIAADNDTHELFRENVNVRFSTMHPSSTLGFASLRSSHNITFNDAGLYWLFGAFPNSPVVQLPLFVERRSSWTLPS